MELPNILMIVIDAGRADHFSCMSHLKPTTPGFDQLANQGVLFRQTISTAISTVPALASLLTGLFPTEHGAHNQAPILDSQARTLPEVLRDHGYVTGTFCTNPHAGSSAGLARGFDHCLELWHSSERRRPSRIARALTRNLFQNADSGCSELLRSIRAFTDQVDNCKAWFVFANLMEPHLPYSAPPEWRYRFLDNRLDACKMDALNPDPIRFNLGELRFSMEERRLLGARYDGQLAYIDDRISAFHAQLRTPKRPLLTIITADHGENLGEHGLIGHEHCIYDTLLRIPWILHCPELLPHQEIHEQVQLLDIPVTILQLLGIKDLRFLGHAQGIDALDEAARKQRVYAFAENHCPCKDTLEDRYRRFPRELVECSFRMIREEDAKFIWKSNGAHEFYDLYRDPMERTNLFPKEGLRAKSYATLLEAWHQECLENAEHSRNGGPPAQDDGRDAPMEPTSLPQGW